MRFRRDWRERAEVAGFVVATVAGVAALGFVVFLAVGQIGGWV